MSVPQWCFDRFRLDQANACLWRGETAIALPPKAFDVLYYLVTHPDRLVTKDDLLDAVWPDTAVSEAVVRVAIGALRKALGDTQSPPRCIATVPRRGYRFLVPVTQVDCATPAPAGAPLVPVAPALPTPVTETCRTCGQVVPLPATFCHGCGQRLEAETPAPPPFPWPTDVTLPSVQRAATPVALALPPTRPALRGERKQVTVLIADIRGAMSLMRDFDPEVVQQLLEPALHAMIESVQRYGGTVHQVHGDAVMALFGAPLAQEDHAIRACYAALAIQTALRVAAEDVRRAHGRPVQCGIGLHAGEVVLRAMRHDLPLESSVLGQTAYLAAHMEQLAPAETILLTAATMRLVEGFMRVKAWGPMPVKAMAEPVEVWELLGASDQRWRLQTARARGLTRFVGRQTELAALHAALTQAGAGHGQLVAVMGEAGVGKSRLVDEFLQVAHAEGWLVLDSAAVSYGQTTPYVPVLALLRRYCHLEEHDAARTVQAKVTAQVLRFDGALQDAIPALLALLDALPADSPFRRLDPAQRRQHTQTALKRLLLRESQAQPMLLVVEDLHWLDTETQAVLDSLGSSLPTARLLLLVNYRPEYRHDWGSKTYYTQLRLDPLPPVSADVFLQSLLGDDPSLASLTSRLIQRTEGNPFFLEESVRMLVETGTLVGQPGAYHMAPGLPAMPMPATVQAVLAARLDQLPPAAKQVLQTAAVLGAEVPLLLLQAIAEQSEAVLSGALAHLQAAEFLYETQLFPARVYTFKHAFTHEVGYGSLLQEQRRTLHAAIVEAIERLFPERLSEQVEQLAYHALRGAVWDKAVLYLQQAGQKAFVHSANREAVALFEQALQALQHLPDSCDTRVRAIGLQLDLRSPLWQLGEIQPMFERLREAETLALGLQDQRCLGRVSAHMSGYYSAIADHQRAVDLAQRSLTIATTLEDIPLQVTANFRLAQAYDMLGDYCRAVARARRNIELLHSDLMDGRLRAGSLSAVTSRWILVLSLAEIGAFAEGITRGQEAASIAERAGHLATRLHAYHCLGFVYSRKGDLQNALPVLERGLELCQMDNAPIWFPTFAAALGSAYALSGRLREAVPLLEQVEKYIASSKATGFASTFFLRVSEGYLLAHRLAEAHTLAEHALVRARAYQERSRQAYALRLLGAVAVQRGSAAAEQAAVHYHQALALAEDLGMRPLQAHCHYGLGTLYAQRDQREQARSALVTAIDFYRAMEMTFWLPQAEAALGQMETRRPTNIL